MIPDYLHFERLTTRSTTLAVLPRQPIKRTDVSISIPDKDLKAVTCFLSSLSYAVSMSNPDSALSIASRIYDAS